MASRSLLRVALIVEPDRQRFARMALDAVQALGGNLFHASGTLLGLLNALRAARAAADMPVEVALVLEGKVLAVNWTQGTQLLTVLDEPPSGEAVRRLAEQLRETSEQADPELLKRRNQRIQADLQAARNRTAREIAELEEMLQKKKQELQVTLRQAETDSLTGLLNRGAFDQRLKQAVHRALRQDEALSLVLLDLDRFKEINDTLGHQHGDRWLQRMAEAMRAACREGVDQPCRIGGDEFAILVFAGADIGERIAAKVLAAMERRVSVGVAGLCAGDDEHTLVARCDAALYQAKTRGRGRVVMAKEPPLRAAPG